ncbi:MAG: hypothetical protein U0R44_00470 [Candidatus Micrarchaeia archaeon]
MAVDERKLGAWILQNPAWILPPASIFVSFYLFSGDMWSTALASLLLGGLYAVRKWDGRALLAFGTLSMAACLAYPINLQAAVRMGEIGFWLIAAGLVALSIGTLGEKEE